MADVETLDTRIYITENEMYLAGSRLNEELHGLEDALSGLAGFVHHLVCESGRVPSERKAFDIVARVKSTFRGLDLATLEADARELAALKGQIEEYEREIAQQQHDATPLRTSA